MQRRPCRALLCYCYGYAISVACLPVVGGVTMYACTGHSIQPSRGSRIEGSVWGNVCVGVCEGVSNCTLHGRTDETTEHGCLVGGGI